MISCLFSHTHTHIDLLNSFGALLLVDFQTYKKDRVFPILANLKHLQFGINLEDDSILLLLNSFHQGITVLAQTWVVGMILVLGRLPTKLMFVCALFVFCISDPSLYSNCIVLVLLRHSFISLENMYKRICHMNI